MGQKRADLGPLNMKTKHEEDRWAALIGRIAERD
jgi:hypothetical protein